jgi:hypothetical protein
VVYWPLCEKIPNEIDYGDSIMDRIQIVFCCGGIKARQIPWKTSEQGVSEVCADCSPSSNRRTVEISRSEIFPRPWCPKWDLNSSTTCQNDENETPIIVQVVLLKNPPITSDPFPSPHKVLLHYTAQERRATWVWWSGVGALVEVKAKTIVIDGQAASGLEVV